MTTSKNARIAQALTETQTLLAKQEAKAALPAECKLEQERQKMIAFCHAHIAKLTAMLA